MGDFTACLLERVEHGFHQRGVESVGHVKWPRVDSAVAERLENRLNSRSRTGYHGLLRCVDGGDGDPVAARDRLRHRGFTRHHRGHGPVARQCLHQSSADGDKLQTLFERHDPNGAGRREFAETVTHHDRRRDAP